MGNVRKHRGIIGLSNIKFFISNFCISFSNYSSSKQYCYNYKSKKGLISYMYYIDNEWAPDNSLTNPQCLSQITPSWNKIYAFDSNCSLRLDFILAIKNPSKIFLVLLFLGADSNTLQLKLCPIFKNRCFDSCNSCSCCSAQPNVLPHSWQSLQRTLHHMYIHRYIFYKMGVNSCLSF